MAGAQLLHPMTIEMKTLKQKPLLAEYGDASSRRGIALIAVLGS